MNQRTEKSYEVCNPINILIMFALKFSLDDKGKQF